MANTSFLLKGWSIVIIAGQEGAIAVLWLGVLLTLVFWSRRLQGRHDRRQLKGKIYDSSMTIVLLSPNMREILRAEDD